MNFTPTAKSIRSMTETREPDFGNLLKVLEKKTPSRPTLFEFFLNQELYVELLAEEADRWRGLVPGQENIGLAAGAFRAAGYDYVTMHGCDIRFPRPDRDRAKSISMSHGGIVTDEESFEKYPWPDPDTFAYGRLDMAGTALPEGMKIIAYGPGGVLENAIALAGYEELCYMMADDPGLTTRFFDAIGSRLLRYYQICLEHDSVGAIISNDDWGFKTQTMLAVPDMRTYVFPWHKRIVEAAHRAGRPAILHSCGQADEIYEDIIEEMGFDGKHSYEDAIRPVEECYDRWGNRLAILGGIDVDYVCRAKPEDVYRRSRVMVEKTRQSGAYALGTGNSVPTYVPWEGYFAMIGAVLEG